MTALARTMLLQIGGINGGDSHADYISGSARNDAI